MQPVRALLVTTAIVILAGCHAVDTVGPVTPTPTVYPPADRPIIFSSLRDSTFRPFNLEIIAAKSDGSDMLNLSRNAANDTDPAWSPDGPMEIKTVRPALSQSYERLCHDAGGAQFLLPLRKPKAAGLISALSKPRLERAIGVIYRPETELQSHYFQAALPHQFDEYIWFDKTEAVTPFKTGELEGLPDTYPFGL